MESAYEIFAGEIAAKGTAYLVLQHCRAGELEELLSRGRAELLGMGASQLYVTSRDPAAPLSEGTWEDFRLEFVRDMLWMERELTALPPFGELTLEPLTRERGGAWITLHNACFFDAPNSSTYGPKDLERAMEEGHRCGFVVAGGVLAGIYELDLTGELPEIEGIALHKDFRGKGLGRQLLHAAMAELAGLDYPRCRLLVATDNQTAFSLYRSAGFKAAGIRSRWFQMLPVFG